MTSIAESALHVISAMAGMCLTDTENDESRDVLTQVARVADGALVALAIEAQRAETGNTDSVRSTKARPEGERHD